MKLAITGGAGFLGRAVIEAARHEPLIDDITVISRDEHKHHRLKAHYPDIRTALCDVRDEERLRALFTGHDLVLHAAAMKYVPEAERDVAEAISTNITGSQNVARACALAGVRRAVAISTDKAVDPVNTYGASKMIMERAWQEASRLYPTDYRLVRYGNVVSSTGSVIPIFVDRLRKGQDAQITSLSMTRFWLDIHDAVRLVMTALLDTPNYRGCIYVDRCAASSIETVVKAAALYLNIRDEPKIQLLGVRPGEKLDEVLVGRMEAQYAIPHHQQKRYTIIPPAVSHHGDPFDSSGMPYSSVIPDRWLEPVDIAQMIRSSEEFEW